MSRKIEHITPDQLDEIRKSPLAHAILKEMVSAGAVDTSLLPTPVHERDAFTATGARKDFVAIPNAFDGLTGDC